MEKFFKTTVICVCAALAGVSCRQINTLFEEDAVARVGDSKLYMSEVQTIFTPGLTPQDSLKLLERYVDSWVKRQLKIQRAEEMFPEDAPDIERMVEDYRSSLLSFKLDQHYVDAQIDTVMTAEDVQSYYDAHRADFRLDRAIVKGVIVKLPENHRQRTQIKDLMARHGEKYQDFLELSRKNGFEVKEITAWTDFADFLNMLPTSKLRDYNEMLAKSGVQEMNDGTDLYYVLITEHLMAGDASPVEREGETIRRVLFNQRRQEIIKDYEKRMYDEAVASKTVEVKEIAVSD